MCQILFSAPEDKQREKGNFRGGVGVLGKMDNKKHNKQASRQAGGWKVLLMGAGSRRDIGQGSLNCWGGDGVALNGMVSGGITKAGSEAGRWRGPGAPQQRGSPPNTLRGRDTGTQTTGPHWTKMLNFHREVCMWENIK